jgi:hypothetical protein
MSAVTPLSGDKQKCHAMEGSVAMTVKLRRGGPADAKECGRIVFEAFKSIATKHNFPQDFTSPEVGAMLMSFLLGKAWVSHPRAAFDHARLATQGEIGRI